MCYISGSQPFPTRGRLDIFCLGSWAAKKFIHFLYKISKFLTTFLVIFPKFFLGSRTIKMNFANVPNVLVFFRVTDRKIIPITICKLVVTQSMKTKGTKS